MFLCFIDSYSTYIITHSDLSSLILTGTTNIATLKYLVEQTFFQDKTGAIIYCNIYTEVGTDKELVQCEICNLYTLAGELHPLPLELIVTSHITHKEESKIGIDPNDIDDYRDNECVFGSDDIQAMVDDERERRKRGMSKVPISTTYSESRQPSPTKVQRM